ncbi:MAG: carboxypeptidase-like regulatory domain-containing protein, partial [Actinomycetota bacterium]
MKFKPDLKIILATFLMALVMLPVMAQERQVTGTVFEPDGVTPILGATVVLKGTATGTSTDARGAYSIRVSGANPVLVFQFLGYVMQEIPVGSQSVINVTLQEEAIEVSAVVVTALGLTREEKSLGYAVTKVNNEELTQVVNSNWLSGMSGKVAGLTAVGASTGPISSMRVTLRGDQSLNYGANEALFIVDGVPVRSGTTATSSSSPYTNSGSDFPVDFGNGASDINPEDIESV